MGKGKKWRKMARNPVYLTLYLRSHKSYDCGFWFRYVKLSYLQ